LNNRLPAKHGAQTQLLPLTGSNTTYRLCFKSTPRRPRRLTARLDRDAAAGHLRGNEMPGFQLLVQRTARAWSWPAPLDNCSGPSRPSAFS